MFSKIMVPVDLRHVEALEKALKVAADLARHYDGEVTYAQVTAPTPGPLGHTPEEVGEKLEAFAKAEGEKRGHRTAATTIIGHDPAIDLDDRLLDATREQKPDLVVMASHLPNVTDYIWPSHGGHLATHADCSVMIVRG